MDNRVWTTSKLEDNIFAGGEGTQENPYLIATADQFRAFAKSFNRKIHYSGKYIKLTENIDISGAEWSPVGGNEYYFDGTFDGNHKTITGMTFGSESKPATSDPSAKEESATYYTLFGDLGSDAVIKNLNIDKSYVNAEPATAAIVAGVASYAEGALIDNVHVTNATLKSKVTVEQNNFVAGIVAVAYQAKIVNCSADVDLTGASVAWSQMAGLVGQNNRSLIANSYATGSIVGGGVYPENMDHEYQPVPVLGGLVGMHAGTLVNSYADVDIKAEASTDYVGGTSAWVTMFGETYQTYFASDAKQEIVSSDGKNAKTIAPAQAVGAIARPGVTASGQAYTGAIELDVKGYTKQELSDAAMATKLNDNLTKLNVDIANGARMAYMWTKSEAVANNLHPWTATEGRVALDPEKVVAATYDPETKANISAYIKSYTTKKTEAEEPTNPNVPTDPNAPGKPEIKIDDKAKKVSKFTAKNGITYKVTSTKYKKVKVYSVAKKTKGKVVIPATVTYKKVKYKVTAVSSKAFYKRTKVKEIVVGKNVSSIGNNAFAKASKLKKITFKTTSLKSKNVSSKAFAGIKKTTKIKVPSKKVKSYKKLFQKKGLNKKVSVKK